MKVQLNLEKKKLENEYSGQAIGYFCASSMLCLFVCLFISLSIYICVCLGMCVEKRKCVCVCVHTCLYVHAFVCVNIIMCILIADSGYISICMFSYNKKYGYDMCTYVSEPDIIIIIFLV